MEERALYRSILDAPHEDAPRLIYADWLDENADGLAEPLARSERGRAEFIRLQCALARTLPEGWRAGARPFSGPFSRRERRLIFQHGRAWRRAFPTALASSPFDRGFLRPLRALTPQQFLTARPIGASSAAPIPSLPDDSPARRYVPDFDPFAACPLWDVHLYAPGWLNDPLSDHGQYGAFLADVAKSPDLERVGWLKVSFFRTSVLDFIRTGNFASVETLVLNAVPFPEALIAVTENESFRSLRYVQFGDDYAVWARGLPQYLRYQALRDRLRVANNRHVPFGEMRAVLRDILRTTPLVSIGLPGPPPAPLPIPYALPAPIPASERLSAPAAAPTVARGCANIVGTVLFALILCAVSAGIRVASNPAPKSPTYPTYQPIRIPDIPPIQYPPKENPEIEALLKRLREGERPFEYRPEFPKWDFRPRAPVAPPPREVQRPTDPESVPDEK